jgi:15-cis-phytoene desaturase
VNSLDTPPRVLVLGAGLAGLTAAHELAVRGISVKVFEAAANAGGRTTSFRDERGREVDTGLHVVADHYVNLIELLSALGVSKRLKWLDKHTYLRAGRPPMQWHFTPLRPPLHLLRPLREMPLGLGERLGLARAGLSLATYEQEDLATLDDQSYLEWHRRRGLGDGFVLELAEAAADAATFLTVRDAAARPVISWLKYLLRHRRAGDVGLFGGTLEECMIGPLKASVERHGGEVRTQTAVVGLDVEGQLVRAIRTRRSLASNVCCNVDGRVATDGPLEHWSADYVISALPVQALGPCLGADILRGAGCAGALGLETTPAISATVWFDRRIEPAPPGAPLVTGCAMRDFVDLTTLGRAQGAPGSVYQFVITRAHEQMTASDADIAAAVVRDLRSVWPGARNAEPIDFSIERIGAAMFKAGPGAHRRRPKTRTAIANLMLAGDYVHHELNASMEGAVLSGRLAANAVLEAVGSEALVVRRVHDPSVVPALRRLAQPLRRAFSFRA